eukprot:CAMPEP_0113558660 /NCGR_PEP_ID=MMETSP0015_2-20120614/18471_1 /TAXON_ID=2838 /ORGANISM="Odontella" /LENGTH=667 /DNA_ID=CAMNT_0000460223 /DNA_START=270 /DNA_END=2273 /DNA_ORIENTATION=- /assembly_acc=CAM_ASM_000160
MSDDGASPRDRNENDEGGVIAVLDLPPGSSLSVDGCAPQVMQRDDFVGISGVSSSFPTADAGEKTEKSPADEEAGLHLVVVRGAPLPSSSSRGGGDKEDGETDSDKDQRLRDRAKGAPTPAVGFLLVAESSSFSSSPSDGWIFARRYDPRTEEPSSEPVDSLTSGNLLRSVREGRSMGPQRVVPYDRFVGGDAGMESWANGTRWIRPSLLRRRGLASGDKVVPGSYEEDNDENNMDDDRRGGGKESESGDGTTPSYPPVPCVDPSSSSPGHPAKKGVHAGTRRYLSSLSPSRRTALFLDPAPGSKVLSDVLEGEYDGNWRDVVGDVQLSFLLFLHLGCLASFEHWRDLVCMLSFAGKDAVGSIPDSYGNLIRVLTHQLSSVESDFFEEVEYSGENFLLPALERLCSLCSASAVGGGGGGGGGIDAGSVDALAEAVSRRFGVRLSYSGAAAALSAARRSQRRLRRRRPDSSDTGTSVDDEDSSGEEEEEGREEEEDAAVMEIDMRDGSTIDLTAANDELHGKGGLGSVATPQSRPGHGLPSVAMGMDVSDDDFDYDDEDGPTVVSAEEVEASLARSSAEDARLASMRASAGFNEGGMVATSVALGAAVEGDYSGRDCEDHRWQYPLLFAALTRGEDVLMACARILDEKKDVSLVREAAAYLEEVEARR